MGKKEGRRYLQLFANKKRDHKRRRYSTSENQIPISKTIISTTKLYKNISLMASGEPENCPVRKCRSMRIGRESLSIFCSLTYPSKLLFLISKNRGSLRISSLCYKSVSSLQGHLLPRFEHSCIEQVLDHDMSVGE